MTTPEATAFSSFPAAPLPVALLACADYESAAVEQAVRAVMDSALYGTQAAGATKPDTAAPAAEQPVTVHAAGGNFTAENFAAANSGAFARRVEAPPPFTVPGCGAHVLVKPNLLRAHSLSCTHALVTRAVCLHLLERGCRVRVADSPGFGTARSVAAAIGLDAALRPLGLKVQPLDGARPVPLGSGGHWGVARLALECDHVISVPKVKAHCQMRASLAVKNLFGCVCGLRKAVAHTRQGKDRDTFTRALLDLWKALPPVSAVADGIVAMHVTGPSGGKPYALGCVGASVSAVALDTAFYALLGAQPEAIPLWAAARQADLPGAQQDALAFPLRSPTDFDAQNFVLPHELVDISFEPHRLLLSLCRRVWSALRA